jgi:hypothetical protein
MTFADYCRWANMGYRDGNPGTEQDVKKRVSLLERGAESYARSVQNLHKKIEEMNKNAPAS